MKTITFTHHEKLLVELCVRTVLCDLLDQEKEAIWSFIATLYNLNIIGDQEHHVEDTTDWFVQIPVLRQALEKLKTDEERIRDAEFDCKPFVLPEETDLVLRKKNNPRNIGLYI